MKARFAVLGCLVGFAVASACGGQKTCDVSNCATGCCSSAGECLPGNTASACGASARQCVACAMSESCAANACTASTVDAGAVTVVDAGLARLALNEIAARGAEFIELTNLGAAVDVSSYAIADSESDGGPKLAEAYRFPSGTTVGAAGFIVVLTSKNTPGPSTECTGGVTACYAATFGVSNSRGETVWLLGPNNEVIDSQSYPANGADAGSALGRLPNGTGAWGVRTPATPGTSNL